MATLEEQGWEKVDTVSQSGSPGDGWELVENAMVPGATGEEAEPWYEDFAEGIGVSGLGTYYGIKDLMGMGTPEDQATLEDWKADAGQSGWGTGGRVVGEIAQLMVPGGAAMKGARAINAINKSKMAQTAAMALTDIAAAGGLGALKLPGEGETRAGNAADEAKAAAIGTVLNPFLLKGIIPKSSAAKKVIDDGVTLSPAQSMANIPIAKPIVETVETLGELVPFVGKSVRESRQRGIDDWGSYVLRNSVPPKYSKGITESGQAGYRQVENAFNQAYKDAWKGVKRVPKDTIDALKAEIKSYMPRLANQRHANALKRVQRTITRESIRGRNRARAIDKAIQDELSKAYKNPGKNDDLINALDELKTFYRGRIPKDVNTKLKNVDKHYSKKLAVEDAVGKADIKKGNFTPDQLIRSSGKIGGKKKRALGTGPLADIAQTGKGLIDADAPPELFNYWRKLTSEKSPSILPMKTAGDIATGQTGLQRAIDSNNLFDWINAGRVGAALED